MKDFLIIANQNAITYKEFFPLLKEKKVRPGYTFNKTMMFETDYDNNLESNRYYVMQHGLDPDKYIKVPGVSWFTTLPTPEKRKLVLTKTYNQEDYPKYDNYDAVEVSKVKDIPYDYDGMMGVPVTILGYDLDKVEIDGLMSGARGEGLTTGNDGRPKFYVGDNGVYARILIKKITN